MRAAAIAMLVLALPLAAGAGELFRCEGENMFWPEHAEDWRLVPVKNVTLSHPRRFSGFDPKHGVDSVAMSAVLEKDGEEPVYDFHIAIEVTRGGRVQRFRVVDRDRADPRVVYEVPGFHSDAPPPRISLAAAPSEPILRLDFHEHHTGAHGEAILDVAAIVDLRADKPRLAILGCDSGWMGGACTAFEAIHSPEERIRCAWSDERADFLCTTKRTLDAGRGVLRAMRRQELLSKKALPVGDPREWIFTASTPRGEVRFLAAPSSTHQLTMTLFALHRGLVETVPVRTLGEEVSTSDVARRDFTFQPPPHTFKARLIATRGKVKTYAVVLTEGKLRALFWVGVDSSSKRPKIDALRVASTAEEYVHCSMFQRPRAISAATWRPDEMTAEVIVEPEYEASSADPVEVAVRDDCAVSATIEWSHEEGFVVTMDEGCAHLGQSVDIDERGALKLVPRKVRDRDALLTKRGHPALFARR